VIEYFSSIFLPKHGRVYKQHTYQSIYYSISANNNSDGRLEQHSLPPARTCLQAAFLSINQSISSNNNSDERFQQHSLQQARTSLQAAYLSINQSINQ